jgi:hypothetical protein
MNSLQESILEIVKEPHSVRLGYTLTRYQLKAIYIIESDSLEGSKLAHVFFDWANFDSNLVILEIERL